MDELRSGRQSVSGRNGIRKHVKSPWVTSPRSRFSSCLAYCVDLQRPPNGNAISTTFSGKSDHLQESDLNRYQGNPYIKKTLDSAVTLVPSKASFNIFYYTREYVPLLNYNNFKFIWLIIIYIIGAIIIQTT